MFHLLVAFKGWPEGGGVIPTNRIYIDSTDEIGRVFLKEEKLDILEVSKIPALLVTETGGDGSQFARVAHITSISQGSRETTIQYAEAGGIPPISNKDLAGFSGQLGIDKFTLTHTHWEINQADLFKILLMNQQKHQLSPKVFNIEAFGRQESILVSVMMPFQAEYDGVYSALQSAVTATGLKCTRADDFWEHQFIMQDIVDLIAKAKVVICDCSNRNPNVFYETGIAHTLGKEVILIAQSENDVPFDLRHIRYIKYLNNKEGLSLLSNAIQSRIRTLVSQRQ
jgi:hypothetical protein